jgi:hypothetical protein
MGHPHRSPTPAGDQQKGREHLSGNVKANSVGLGGQLGDLVRQVGRQPLADHPQTRQDGKCRGQVHGVLS